MGERREHDYTSLSAGVRGHGIDEQCARFNVSPFLFLSVCFVVFHHLTHSRPRMTKQGHQQDYSCSALLLLDRSLQH